MPDLLEEAKRLSETRRRYIVRGPDGELNEEHAMLTAKEAAVVLAAIPELVERVEQDRVLLSDCLDYFKGFDFERTDGKTSPIIPRLEEALATQQREVEGDTEDVSPEVRNYRDRVDSFAEARHPDLPDGESG